MCKIMQYIFLKKVKKINLEILTSCKKIPSFMFCCKFYLVINKIKAKFVIGESKYVCGYYKIIWTLTLNAIAIFKFI